MTKEYFHILDGQRSRFSVGKVVCVGRNYAAHAKELNNPIPDEPLLFMKANNALVSLDEVIALPSGKGTVHFETELAVLIGQRLCDADEPEALSAIAGIGVALDLTLRDVQSDLKKKGLPWERAKAFDRSCPVSGFVSFSGDLQNLSIRLEKNGKLVQDGNTVDMLFPVLDLISKISECFTLLPGDIILTGTPEGVGPLESGDVLEVALSEMAVVKTSVV